MDNTGDEIKEDVLFRRIFEDHSAIKLIIDPNSGSIVYANRSAEDFYGWSKEQLLCMKIQDINTLAPELINEAIKSAVTFKQVNFEFHHKLADGSVREVEVLSSNINFNGKNLLQSIVTDVTDRKLNEKIVGLDTSRLTRAELASKSGNWELHLDSQMIHISEGAAKIYGLKQNEFQYESIKKFPLPKYRKILDIALQDLLEHKKPYDLEFKIKTADTGEIKDIHSIATYDEENNALFGVIQDITERKRIEKALLEEKERYRSIFENISIGLYRTTPEGKILMANPATLKMLGFSSFEELAKRNLEHEGFELSFTRKKFRQQIEQNNEVKGFESIWLRKDGTPLYISESAKIIRDETGKILYYEGTVEDITGRKLAEDALRKSLEINQAMIDANPDILFKVNKQGIILDYHAPSDQQLYVSPALFLGKQIKNVLPVDVAKQIMKKIKQSIDTNQLVSMEYELSKDGETGYFDNRIIPIGNDEVFTFIRNITTNKLAQEALRKSEEKFRILNVITAEMLLEPNLQCLYKYIATSLQNRFKDTIILYNSIADEKDESKLETIIGIDNSLLKKAMNIAGFNPIGKKFRIFPTYYEIIKSGKLIEFKNGLGEFSGGLIPEIIGRSIEQIIDINKIYTIGIWNEQKLLAAIHFFTLHNNSIEDKSFIETFAHQAGIVIQKKITEQSLLESEHQLKELNATKDKFFSIIAHDLKSPFNSIIGFSNILTRQIEEKDYDGLGKYSEIILNSSQHALDLLMNLLDWSRSQTGSMKFTPEKIDLRQLVDQVAEQLYNQAFQKSITIYIEMPQKVPVSADKAMINTILRNLISNAIKFTNANGEIVVSTKIKPSELVVSISDTGIGIKQGIIDRLFRIDENQSTMGTNNEKGTGLGLILCKEFIEKHGGRICIESEEGKGSRFYFTIPK